MTRPFETLWLRELRGKPTADRSAARGLCAGPRGRASGHRSSALRRAARRRARHALRRRHRDAHRRGQDPRCSCAGGCGRAERRGRPCPHLQRLSRPARCRVDGSGLWRSRSVGRVSFRRTRPSKIGSGPTTATSPTSRPRRPVRLPAGVPVSRTEPAPAARGGIRAGRRGRLHPHRRGADPTGHRRHGGGICERRHLRRRPCPRAPTGDRLRYR